MSGEAKQACQVPPPLPVIRPAEWAHVVVRTADPERMMEWYCTVLGAQIVLRHKIINFISWDDSQDRMAFLPDPNPTEGSRIDHFAVTYRSCADLAATYRRLAEIEIEPHEAINHGVASSFYYRDPDGNRLELSVENFPNVESLNEWLASGDFDANPYGVRLPPDVLAQKLEAAGESRLAPETGHREWLADRMKEMAAKKQEIAK